MKKYIPYIFNFTIVFIGIIIPYYLFQDNAIYNDYELIFFLLFSFAFTFVLNIFIDISVKYWIFSSIIFYLTVFFVFLLGDQWGLRTQSIFYPYQIEHHSGKNNDPLPHILEFDYPIGILILTILNLICQLVSKRITSICRYISKWFSNRK